MVMWKIAYHVQRIQFPYYSTSLHSRTLPVPTSQPLHASTSVKSQSEQLHLTFRTQRTFHRHPQHTSLVMCPYLVTQLKPRFEISTRRTCAILYPFHLRPTSIPLPTKFRLIALSRRLIISAANFPAQPLLSIASPLHRHSTAARSNSAQLQPYTSIAQNALLAPL
jgi:hypothetical protein